MGGGGRARTGTIVAIEVRVLMMVTVRSASCFFRRGRLRSRVLKKELGA